MSTCGTCTVWCATTENQLATRYRNMGLAPEVQPHACPSCGGVEWMTTDRFVVRESAPRDWVTMTWRERTWRERVMAAVCLAIVWAVGIGGVFLFMIYVLGPIIDQNDRRSMCLRKAGESVELQRRC